MEASALLGGCKYSSNDCSITSRSTATVYNVVETQVGTKLLFLLMQALHITARDMAAASRHPLHEANPIKHDGHDNNWILLEFALAVPLVLGFKTAVVSRILIAALLAEAVTCWQFWQKWPTWYVF